VSDGREIRFISVPSFYGRADLEKSQGILLPLQALDQQYYVVVGQIGPTLV
jgi:hypothetical protein